MFSKYQASAAGSLDADDETRRGRAQARQGGQTALAFAQAKTAKRMRQAKQAQPS